MLANAFLLALREIRRNLTRAVLTVLGIIIGVSAVITMVTLGRGTTTAVQNQISSLGSNLLMLRPGMGFGSRGSSAGVPLFRQEDVEAITNQIHGLAGAVPTRNASLSTIYRQNARSTGIVGTWPDYFKINNWTLARGRLFSEADSRVGKAVCVIGETVRREMFGTDEAIGEKLRIGRSTVEVIGILASKGQSGMGDADDTIVVPLTTLERRLVGRTSANTVNSIAISAADGTDTTELITAITSLMRQRRNLQPNQDNNFNIFDTRQLAETLSSSTKMMTSLLAAVAGVSLLVGGIGIMNIMLVSVTERTREIGIRLAIGARAKEVLLQFLVEAVTLSCIGGLIGILLALALCNLLAPLIQVPTQFYPNINLIAFAFSAAVGIVFGYAPARRAAALNPIDALRHE